MTLELNKICVGRVFYLTGKYGNTYVITKIKPNASIELRNLKTLSTIQTYNYRLKRLIKLNMLVFKDIMSLEAINMLYE